MLQALNNGLLVDPHDDKAIADALLKLVSERALWTECRRNGLKNIHLFSWPEHCRTYLSKIAQCRMRHPQWQNESSADADVDAESQGDSLNDIRDLRLSIDGERLGGSLNNAAVEYLRALSNKEQVPEGRSSSIRRSLSKLVSMREEDGATEHDLDNGPESNGHRHEPVASSGDHHGQSKGPIVRKRKRLVVVAVDSYSASGEPAEGLISTLQGVLKDLKSKPGTGIILSTALTVSEVEQLLQKNGIHVNELDAVVCSSGSKMYYPSDASPSGETQLCVDPDYEQHIAYRWGGEGLRKTMARFLNSVEGDKEPKKDRGLAEDEQLSNAQCFSYKVTNPSVVRFLTLCACQASTDRFSLPINIPS